MPTYRLAAALSAAVLVASGLGVAAANPSQPAAPAAVAAAVVTPDSVVAAVGDIACAPGFTVTSSSCQQKAVSDKILAANPAALLGLGDQQYESGALSAYKSSYGPTFGRLNSVVRPVPGNHEYKTAGATGYYDYFGARAGDRTKGYYSFNVGAWHFVALNSEKDIGATDAQVAWLKADLAANKNNCVGAYWHKPRFSTGSEHGDNTAMAPFWSALYAAKADLVLNGHDHDYERFKPLNPSGQVDTTNGITEIVSGLGGKNRYSVAGRSTTAAKNQSGFGFTKLTLHASSADISYVAATGSYSDRSTLTCHGAAAPSPTPTPTPSPSVTPTSSATDLPPLVTPSPSDTASPTPSVTPTPCATVTVTATPSSTPPASTEAAALNGWGTAFTGDEFNYVGPPNSTKWNLYNSAGHAGNGLRRPSQDTVNGQYLTITGKPDGTTGGMSDKVRGTTYGRWEARMRVPTRSVQYHPVLIVWPDAGRVASTNYEEIDFSEATDLGNNHFYLHAAAGSAGQSSATTAIDMTQWHNYAVDWQPNHVTGYIDGVKWFDMTGGNASKITSPAHLTLQLDWFPGGTTTTSHMDVDWVRQYKP